MDTDNVQLVGDEPYDRFEALPRPSAIFLYGVNEMSTKDIEQYVDSTLLIKIEWINDSSCNLVFDNPTDASTVASSLLLKNNVVLDHRTLVPAKPYLMINHDHQVIDLFIRIATDEDVKERGARSRSRYYQLHGVDGQTLSEERKEARREHIERMKRNGGDGSDVFSRLGKKVENTVSSPSRRRYYSRSRSRSPLRNSKRSSSTRRERSPPIQKEIPEHLKSRLGPIKTSEISQEK
ncbi:uncharacterized protein BX663DRAFT_495182 [Cokeromyces recurvatus]|uniref:uncharacterized protein n=1 Tax=Cokeromyces recurvatus TaxID=90255 RepID=UPI00221FB9A3|nr:uncharacterized protein BX663DRAFT_495182 [Cokeromyces recurvatus]KAI7907207.1 hypothetical protein BX663DRAFT_495182 [Cokeromyces recurvatus]